MARALFITARLFGLLFRSHSSGHHGYGRKDDRADGEETKVVSVVDTRALAGDATMKLMKSHYGTALLHKKEPGIKKFALGSTKADGKRTAEPFVFRNYNGDDESNRKQFRFEGTHKVSLWEAMSATTAIPVVSERTPISIDGTEKKIADGFHVANNPTAVAIAESKSLWPRRPIGVILVLGLSEDDTEQVKQAVEKVQWTEPLLDYVRLRPPIHIHALEHDTAKLQTTLDDAYTCTLQSTEIARILNKLRQSPLNHRATPRCSTNWNRFLNRGQLNTAVGLLCFA